VSRPPLCLATLTAEQLEKTSMATVGHYDDSAEGFWQGTRDHDVRQNVEALLRHLPASGPLTILDLGCGPGRDLITFRDLGHVAVGLDGAEQFVRMARQHSGCEVLHQDFLQLDLAPGRFDGIFANATLFHVPSQELPRVLTELWAALARDGVLFCSNPHGPNREGWSGDRYCCYLDLDTFRGFMTEAGFVELEHYYRPPGKPRDQQPWLASVWRKGSGDG
jgi:SAM-dependent methyltransferase